MGTSTNVSAGLLLFRRGSTGLEVYLAHPGGPFWANKDEGAWTIPKGEPEMDEDQLAAARREFQEETGVVPQPPFLPLGCITQKSGKIVHAWAWEGEATAGPVPSNKVKVVWPPGSGRWLSVPEVDRCEWFGLVEAARKINPAQAELLQRLAKLV